MVHLSDESLMSRIQEGSHEAFAALVDRHSNRFYRIAYRLVACKNDAEDIVQQAFLKLWDRPGHWIPGKRTKFTTWFYRVVINLCIDYRRRRKRIVVTEKIEVADENPGQELLLARRQKEALLERFIGDLPERQQLALNLCFHEGIGHEEAAAIVGVSVKALQSLLMRAKTTLKRNVRIHFDGD